jgi:hypothetical protein
MKVILHPEAHEEMIELARIYEGRSEGFGSDFLTAVEETKRRIEQFPEAGPIERANIRKRLVSGFPFTIFTKYSLISSSLQLLCTNIAGPTIGENACRLKYQADRALGQSLIITAIKVYRIKERNICVYS